MTVSTTYWTRHGPDGFAPPMLKERRGLGSTLGAPTLAIVSLALLLFTGCTRKTEEQKWYYLTGAGFSGDPIVNGNPVDRGIAVSLFIVEGENDVRIHGETPTGGYVLMLGKTSQIMSHDYESVIHHEEDSGQSEVDRTFRFREGSWFHWAWQDADPIDRFTAEDRKAIDALVDAVCEQVQKREFSLDRARSDPRFRLWSDDPELLARTGAAWLDMVKKIEAYDELTFKRTELEDLQASVGTRIVMLRPEEGGNIFYLGPDPEKRPTPENGKLVMTYSYSLEAIYFAKFGGRWVMLVPVT